MGNATPSGVSAPEPSRVRPEQGRQVIDGLNVLKAIRQRNTLAVLGEEGFAGRQLRSADDQFATIMKKSLAAAGEIESCYASAKLAPTATAASAWGLLREGGQADLSDIAFDSAADGYASERVKAPKKRRIPIMVPEPVAAP